MKPHLAFFVASLLFLTAACTSDSSSDDPGGSGGFNDGGGSKYDQTWSTAYDQTTCSQWAAQMTSRQQWAAAADMLTGARNKGDGGVGVAPDDLVTQFRRTISDTCEAAPQMSIAEVAVGEYLTSRDKWRP